MSWSQKGRQLTQSLKQVNWYLCTGLLFLFSVIFGIGWIAHSLHDVLNDADALPIEAIAVKGERQFTSDAEIQQALQSMLANSFFNADVMDVQKALEALPWVYHASVRREWPAKFKVTLQEQQALAHWNVASWVNVKGEVFDALMHPELENLPLLAGPEGSAKEVLTVYQQLNELLSINGFNLASLHLSPRHAWFAVLDNGIKIDLGREDKMSRVQRFINVYPTLMQSDKKIDTIDLRYDTGFAVGWQKTKKENRR
ncbi:cell division protein FtsQ/DivIB [Shewanella intestini]|uniref:Cell division protein FtsQ n=1 Tax=Shewanella intestini TaxID=2017544 RepID=A0ABS5I5Q5_9GAMM|nr:MULTISPECIES: cell division protein FtsQ/DivIB [Shewanella]MBR9729044.1 FtsQ-type POTRA domain-containing protein [Shewanella intestini]MRG37120.1 FtsQ-type POTRA domain-containing protein [Shewanella sp. XMDDZSB0408]